MEPERNKMASEEKIVAKYKRWARYILTHYDVNSERDIEALGRHLRKGIRE